jgi:hypothetical protein
MHRDVSIPLCPCMCVHVTIPIRLLDLPLLSAVPSLCGTLRTRGLVLTTHAASKCYGRLGEVVEICDLTLENVHSHIVQ